MAAVSAAFDLVLAALLALTAWLALDGRGLIRTVMLALAFGLLLTLAWVRLGAADLALAEAVLGTGVTVVLLIELLARLRGKTRG